MANNDQPKIVIPNLKDIGPKYSNYVLISNAPHEFTITFCYLDPAQISKGETPTVNAEALSRIIISPSLLPEIIKVFEHNLDKYNTSIKMELEKKQ